jgi:hypothetical protein
MSLNLMCEQCGKFAGLPKKADDLCRCGGRLEDMPEDIIRGLGALAPKTALRRAPVPKLDPFVAAIGATALLAFAYLLKQPAKSR